MNTNADQRGNIGNCIIFENENFYQLHSHRPFSSIISTDQKGNTQIHYHIKCRLLTIV